jgi:hypothetical protein
MAQVGDSVSLKFMSTPQGFRAPSFFHHTPLLGIARRVFGHHTRQRAKRNQRVRGSKGVLT